MISRNFIRLIACFFWFVCTTFSEAQSYTCVSYNIRYDNPQDGEDNWIHRREDLSNTVMSFTPDIIALQEAQVHQVNFLAQQWPGYAWYGIGREDGAEKGEFVPVYYDTARFDLLSAKTIWLSETPEIPGKGWDAACERVAALVWLMDKKSRDSLLIVNTHWDHIGVTARQESAELILSNLETALKQKRRIILLGDFNASGDEASVALLEQTLADVCPKKMSHLTTFNAFEMDGKTSKHIDHVFISPHHWKVVNYKIPHPQTKQGRQVSDHYPVVVKLKNSMPEKGKRKV